MELREYLAVLRKYWVSIVAVTLVGLVLGTLSSLPGQRPIETARSAVFLAVRTGETAREVIGGATYASSQVQSYIAVAKTPKVLGPVIEKFALDVTPSQFVDESLDVTAPTGTSVIEITVQQDDATRAAGIAQAIAEQLVLAVQQLSPKDSNGAQTVVATIITPAEVITPEDNGFSTGGARLGLLVGLVLGLGQAIVRLLLGRFVTTPKQATRVTGKPVLAEVPFAVEPMAEAQLEPYRRLRNNLRAVLPSEPVRAKSLVVTSSTAGEGKTTVAVNLARAFAGAGESVLLIDANLRQPDIGQRLGLGEDVGLTSILAGQAEIGDAVQSLDDGRLDVLAAGPLAATDPADLLASAEMAHLVHQAEDAYDYVILDVADVGAASEPGALAAMAGGALIVAGTRAATIESLQQTTQALDQVGAITHGLLLNRHKPRS